MCTKFVDVVATGKDGPWHTTSVVEQTPLGHAFLEACEKEGIPRVYDINGDTSCGALTFQTFSFNGRRSRISNAYLGPTALARANLTVGLGCYVTKIIFSADGTIAEAVQFQTKQNGRTFTVKVAREAVLSAGAIQSPQVLEMD
jgi:choline dehydrogenase-like flavoprotein